tara:strand:- start:322 stop:2253 length:1932 start_codon:yes stop_codon:yes gene_type:complete
MSAAVDNKAELLQKENDRQAKEAQKMQDRAEAFQKKQDAYLKRQEAISKVIETRTTKRILLDDRLQKQRRMLEVGTRMGSAIGGGVGGSIFGFMQQIASMKVNDYQERKDALAQQKKMWGNINSKGAVGGFKQKEQTGLLSRLDKTMDKAFGGDSKWNKMFGGHGRMAAMGAGMGAAGAGIAIGKSMIDSSPLLQSMLKLMKFGFMLILKPIGDFFGMLMRPIMILMLRKFIIPFYQSAYPWFAKTGMKLGEDISKILDKLTDPTFWSLATAAVVAALGATAWGLKIFTDKYFNNIGKSVAKHMGVPPIKTPPPPPNTNPPKTTPTNSPTQPRPQPPRGTPPQTPPPNSSPPVTTQPKSPIPPPKTTTPPPNTGRPPPKGAPNVGNVNVNPVNNTPLGKFQGQQFQGQGGTTTGTTFGNPPPTSNIHSGTASTYSKNPALRQVQKFMARIGDIWARKPNMSYNVIQKQISGFMAKQTGAVGGYMDSIKQVLASGKFWETLKTKGASMMKGGNFIWSLLIPMMEKQMGFTTELTDEQREKYLNPDGTRKEEYDIYGNDMMLAKGGMINERVDGIGRTTGKSYSIGEAGSEMVIPMSKMGSMMNGGSTTTVNINIDNMSGNANDLNKLRSTILEVMQTVNVNRGR